MSAISVVLPEELAGRLQALAEQSSATTESYCDIQDGKLTILALRVGHRREI